MDVPRIQLVQRQFHAYGGTTAKMHVLRKKFATDLIAALNLYLHPLEQVAYGVPPTGNWSWSNYRDQALSSFGTLLHLRTVELGIAFRVPHSVGDQADFVRLVIPFKVKASGFEVFVGSHRFDVPLNCRDAFSDLCEAIFQLLMAFFGEEHEEFRSGDTLRFPIGFDLSRSSID